MQYLPGLGLSDHLCHGNYMQDKKPKYNFCQADFVKMRALIEAINWEDALNSLDIYQAWDVFTSYYESILKECIPYHVPKIRKEEEYLYDT